MSITATELKTNLNKYLLLSSSGDIYITRNSKNIAKPTNPYFKICDACNISADYIILGHKKGFDRDICIEVLNSFSDEQLEHVTSILQEIKYLSNSSDR
jgi:hypothetical protein